MSVTTQRKRGGDTTTPTAGSYTGPIGEIIVDTQLWGVRIQDGVTPGGHLLSGSVITSNVARDMRTVASGLAYTVGPLTTAVTQVVWRSATGGNKSTVIPGPSSSLKGYELDIKLTRGNSDSHTITPTSGTIDGAANKILVDNQDNLSLVADSDATDWIVV